MNGDEEVGVIRIVDKKDESRKRISPVWIMSEHRNKGNLHLYEKLGYHQTRRVDKINDRMDIVFYEKD